MLRGAGSAGHVVSSSCSCLSGIRARGGRSCPVETGEILAGGGEKCEGHALVAVGLEKNLNLVMFPIVHDVLPAVRRYLHMRYLSSFQPEPGLRVSQPQQGGSGEIQHRGCVSCHGDARPGRRRWGPGGSQSDARHSMCISAALCQTPGEDLGPIQSASRLWAKVGDQSGVTTAPATTIYR